MSILIRGMQMPKNCGVCPLRGCGYLCCPDTENERLIRTEYMCSDDLKRPDWCPITDLGSHGDLIDRNEFLVKMNLAIALIKTGMVVLDAKDDKELKMELKTYLDIAEPFDHLPDDLQKERMNETQNRRQMLLSMPYMWKKALCNLLPTKFRMGDMQRDIF